MECGGISLLIYTGLEPGALYRRSVAFDRGTVRSRWTNRARSRRRLMDMSDPVPRPSFVDDFMVESPRLWNTAARRLVESVFEVL